MFSPVKRLRHTLLLLVFSAFSGAVWVAHRPADWRPLPQADRDRKPPLDVLDQLGQSAIKRSAPFELTEARVNAHLRDVLQPQVTAGVLSRWLEPQPPQIELQEEVASLRLRWLLGSRHACDLTVNLALHREETRYRVEILDGAYGRLKVPRGLLHPVRSALARLADALEPEINALFQMNQVRITEGKLMLDPRFAEPAAPS